MREERRDDSEDAGEGVDIKIGGDERRGREKGVRSRRKKKLKEGRYS